MSAIVKEYIDFSKLEQLAIAFYGITSKVQALNMAMRGFNHTFQIIDDPGIDGREKNLYNAVLAKLQLSEKRMLRELGQHPRKDKTNNLINYLHILTHEEQEFLVLWIKENTKRHSFHLGLLPFLERDYVLNLLYDYGRPYIRQEPGRLYRKSPNSDPKHQTHTVNIHTERMHSLNQMRKLKK